MAFTVVPITGTFKDAAGNVLSGSFTFTLTNAITNDGETIPASPITTALAAGALSLSLVSPNDPDTTPPGVWYGVTENLAGCQPRDYFVTLPGTASETNGTVTAGSDLVQLSSLKALGWMVGCQITGTGIPSGTTITAILQNTNELQLSQSATASGTGLTLTVAPPASVDISTLVPGDTGWL